MKKATKELKQNYCGIIFANGGGIWAWGDTKEETVKATVKHAKKELRAYGFVVKKGHSFNVNLLDMHGHSGWEEHWQKGIIDSDTGKPITEIEIVKAS